MEKKNFNHNACEEQSLFALNEKILTQSKINLHYLQYELTFLIHVVDKQLATLSRQHESTIDELIIFTIFKIDRERERHTDREQRKSYQSNIYLFIF